MGLGKFLLGGVCAAGAVIAAPAALTAAGATILLSTTSAAAASVGTAMIMASGGTAVAATAGVAAGAAGLALGAAEEDKVRAEGKKEGYNKASDEYKAKLEKQAKEFNRKIDAFEKNGVKSDEEKLELNRMVMTLLNENVELTKKLTDDDVENQMDLQQYFEENKRMIERLNILLK